MVSEEHSGHVYKKGLPISKPHFWEGHYLFSSTDNHHDDFVRLFSESFSVNGAQKQYFISTVR